jgi:IMP dehydrogenase
MQLYNNNKQLCFDDILLVPQASDVVSRSEVGLSMSIGYDKKAIELYLPVVTAPMDTVCEETMATEISSYGGLGIIHRFMDFEQQKNQVFNVAKKGLTVGAAVGLKDAAKNAQSLALSGAKVICLDIANGHSSLAVDAVREIRKLLPDIHIMTGNVSTWDGFLALSLAGADSIRVGIGGGSMCTTRLVTGHGMPTLSSIMDIRSMLERMDLPTSIIADGGIRNAGDMAKAFAAGSDAVMLGSVLAGHDESPGELMFDNADRPFKNIRGMASAEAQINFKGSASVVEGISSEIAYRGAVSNTLNEIRGGLASACSYSGVYQLEDLAYNSQYVIVSTNSVKENQPHGQRNI